jgi:nitroreductase
VDGPNPTRSAGTSIYPAVQNMLLAARALGLGSALTTRYITYKKEVDAAMGIPPGFHSYAILPIGYPMGRFGPVGRGPLADVVYLDGWGSPTQVFDRGLSLYRRRGGCAEAAEGEGASDD